MLDVELSQYLDEKCSTDDLVKEISELCVKHILEPYSTASQILEFASRITFNQLSNDQFKETLVSTKFLDRICELIEQHRPELIEKLMMKNCLMLETYYGMEWELQFIHSDKHLKNIDETSARIALALGNSSVGFPVEYDCDLNTVKHIINELESAYKLYVKKSI
ncbi:hypothetical protein RF11_08153 [Thelohanellus kitauei]|uniref:COMM domain-containing protein n=1 Tax=Thelohanellus kitauei TaxID=669202 RepID=A0A0C2M8P5_THEKT|nr:hypothetical protein RF11_08153 [Thelohanellus kitauei]